MAKQPLTFTQPEKDMILSGLISLIASTTRKANDGSNPQPVKDLWKKVTKDAEQLAARIDTDA